MEREKLGILERSIKIGRNIGIFGTLFAAFKLGSIAVVLGVLTIGLHMFGEKLEKERLN